MSQLYQSSVQNEHLSGADLVTDEEALAPSNEADVGPSETAEGVETNSTSALLPHRKNRGKIPIRFQEADMECSQSTTDTPLQEKRKPGRPRKNIIAASKSDLISQPVETDPGPRTITIPGQIDAVVKITEAETAGCDVVQNLRRAESNDVEVQEHQDESIDRIDESPKNDGNPTVNATSPSPNIYENSRYHDRSCSSPEDENSNNLDTQAGVHIPGVVILRQEEEEAIRFGSQNEIIRLAFQRLVSIDNSLKMLVDGNGSGIQPALAEIASNLNRNRDISDDAEQWWSSLPVKKKPQLLAFEKALSDQVLYRRLSQKFKTYVTQDTDLTSTVNCILRKLMTDDIAKLFNKKGTIQAGNLVKCAFENFTFFKLLSDSILSDPPMKTHPKASADNIGRRANSWFKNAPNRVNSKMQKQGGNNNKKGQNHPAIRASEALPSTPVRQAPSNSRGQFSGQRQRSPFNRFHPYMRPSPHSYPPGRSFEINEYPYTRQTSFNNDRYHGSRDNGSPRTYHDSRNSQGRRSDYRPHHSFNTYDSPRHNPGNHWSPSGPFRSRWSSDQRQFNSPRRLTFSHHE